MEDKGDQSSQSAQQLPDSWLLDLLEVDLLARSIHRPLKINQQEYNLTIRARNLRKCGFGVFKHMRFSKDDIKDRINAAKAAQWKRKVSGHAAPATPVPGWIEIWLNIRRETDRACEPILHDLDPDFADALDQVCLASSYASTEQDLWALCRLEHFTAFCMLQNDAPMELFHDLLEIVLAMYLDPSDVEQFLSLENCFIESRVEEREVTSYTPGYEFEQCF